MKLLIAEDELLMRHVLETLLAKWGYEVVVASDGPAAWQELQKDDAPPLAVLDWMLPQMSGIDLCRRLRASARMPTYVILLTAKTGKEALSEGLEAGANDYIMKPFEWEELRARVRVGAQVIHLQTELAERARRLAEALAQVEQLQGLLPLCADCKQIRNDPRYRHDVETYLSDPEHAKSSRSLCPTCSEKAAESVAPEDRGWRIEDRR